MPTPIQDEPESTVGRKPERIEHPDPAKQDRAPSGAPAGREAGGGREPGERERSEPPTDE